MIPRVYCAVSDAAELRGVSERRIRKLCEQGRIEGAYKCSGVWLIPMPVIVLPRPRVASPS